MISWIKSLFVKSAKRTTHTKANGDRESAVLEAIEEACKECSEVDALEAESEVFNASRHQTETLGPFTEHATILNLRLDSLLKAEEEDDAELRARS